jgi:hypothetical protein
MNMSKLTKEEFKKAITEGVYQAFWQMITHATHAPCHNFFDTIKGGLRRRCWN